MTPTEKRALVIAKYKTLLGRNRYSQAKRGYAFKKHSDGHYYSDCSSSVALSYREAGFPIAANDGNTCPNTVGMYQSKNLTDVPAVIENGLILNPEILRPGDLLLFAGSDSSRAGAGYVGHVEMVAQVSGSKVTIYGHGSGTPRATEMNAYLKSRHSKKTNTRLGHKGLIRVRRLIPDEAPAGPRARITGNTVNLRSGPGTSYPVLRTARKGESLPIPDTQGWLPVTDSNRVCWVSGKYAQLEGST